MNLGYVEKNDKISVIDEYGNKIERENTDNIEQILIYENRIDKIHDVEHYYREMLEQIQSSIFLNENNINSTKKYITIILSLTFLFVVLLLKGDIITLLMLCMMPAAVLGVPIVFGLNDLKKLKNREIELEYLLEKINEEKAKVENKLEEIKLSDKPKENNSNSNDYKKLNDTKYNMEFTEYLHSLNNNQEQLNNKTLKKVRK